MSICDDVKKVCGTAPAADLSGYYALSERCRRIYAGSPDWKTVKKAGLYGGGSRSLNMLGAAKVLCDRFASFTFCEPPEISFSDEKCGDFIRGVLDKNGFYGRMTEILSRAYAFGGCVFRPYLNSGETGIDCVYGDSFVPLSWDSSGIREGCFRSVTYRDGYRYTLYELHKAENGVPVLYHKLFKSKNELQEGAECELSELYPDLTEKVVYEGVSNGTLFSRFKAACTNNIFPEIPLGISVFAGACDTLKALDVAFDSFAREFILGRKRIIVPSSCVQTVVDIATGEPRRYFDADDEAYVALKCDEERDLKITDNTVELRVDEHVKAINALLNILCFQTGLSAGTFSFDVNEGVKTATEIISRDSKTAVTIRANQNALTEALISLFRSIASLGKYSGALDSDVCDISISWHDGIITDENTLISNCIRLVESGLKSKISAIMEISKCGYEEAFKELERIKAEK